jgi:predicted RNase H-like nuclease (RuvC/YqgF family)
MPKASAGKPVTEKYLDQRLEKSNAKLKEELYEIKDEIVGEIKAMRDEFNAHQYSHARINDELQDHDKRIGKLEAATTN